MVSAWQLRCIHWLYCSRLWTLRIRSTRVMLTRLHAFLLSCGSFTTTMISRVSKAPTGAERQVLRPYGPCRFRCNEDQALTFTNRVTDVLHRWALLQLSPFYLFTRATFFHLPFSTSIPLYYVSHVARTYEFRTYQSLSYISRDKLLLSDSRISRNRTLLLTPLLLVSKIFAFANMAYLWCWQSMDWWIRVSMFMIIYRQTASTECAFEIR